MKRAALGWVMGLAFGVVSAQQVWRCEQDGQVRYTDQPCEKSEKGGRPLPARQLKANVADGLAAEAAQTPASAASGALPAADPLASAASAASAPGDADASGPAASAPSPPPANSRRGHRVRFAQVAMQGLMHTDFVQRGYVPRRQNPASTHP